MDENVLGLKTIYVFHFYFHEIWQKVFRRKEKKWTVSEGKKKNKEKRFEGKERNAGGGSRGRTHY